MKVVFFGASKFGLRCLEEIISLPYCKVVGVVTVPKTFSISYSQQKVNNVLHSDINGYCKDLGINCLTMMEGMNDPVFIDQIKKLDPDMFIVVGWYHMVPKCLRDIAPAYGMHASLLPDYSGGAPLVWALINGEQRTGITFFQLDGGVDSGPIIGQQSLDITSQDTIASLYERIETAGVGLLQKYLPRMADGSVQPIVQDDSQRRTFPQRSPEDGIIDWSLPAEVLYNFIRAQTKPYPGAFSMHGKNKITIWGSRIASNEIKLSLNPGEIKCIENRIIVGCGKESLELTDIALNGEDLSAYTWWSQQTESGERNGFIFK